MTPSPTHDEHAEPTKKAAINGLAAIGFLGLIIAGILLAVYASRYIPETLARLSSAVYLSSDAAKNGKATTTPAAPAPTVTVTPATPAQGTPIATSTSPSKPSTGGPYIVQQPRVIQTGPKLYGYPDLAVTDVQRSGSSRDMRVTFIVRNIGTNAVSGWSVRVRIEGEQDAIAYGGMLYPNGYQTFTLRATDLTRSSPDLDIEADYQNAVIESNENNNDYSTNGSSNNNSSNDNVSCNLDASDTRVSDGDRITLEWDTDGNPNYASINQGIGRVDEDGGSERVRVTDDTTFRMTVRNSHGDEDTCSVTVRVD